LLNSVKNHPFFIKLLNWEYWPFGILQAPLFLMWIGYALRQRSLFYFSASNPSILTGGMMGESKFAVLQLLPPDVRPQSMRVRVPTPFVHVLEAIEKSNFRFPFIVKPDLGERGWMVRRIHHRAELETYWQEAEKIPVDFIVQELVDLPLEFGVFYQRHPAQESGRVTSVAAKNFLSVTGDGKQTVEELIRALPRARLQWHRLKNRFAHRLPDILAAGEKLELEPIGNHCLGTTFFDANHLITGRLSASFDRISKQIPEFYFGRYDLRCASLADLENGVVQVMELNGCGAEPAHIYQPGASFFRGVKTLVRHWHTLYQISAANHKRGVHYLSLHEAWLIYRRVRALKK